MNRIFFISDYFYSTHLPFGGAERCDDVLLQELLNKKYNDYKEYMTVFLQSHVLVPEVIDKNSDATFFISNFKRLSEECKSKLIEANVNYIIIEHDHKYLKSDNPLTHKNMLSNVDGLQNVEFFKNARAVLCQSTYASEILYKNLSLRNLINLKGNLWSNENIDALRNTLAASKPVGERSLKWSILNSRNKNKGISETIEYCVKKNINFNTIGHKDWNEFIKQIATTDGVIFFPSWVETFNRFVVEARVLNCKIMSNSKVGCINDGWLNYKGEALLEQMGIMKSRIFDIYENLILNKDVDFFKVEMPRVTIMTTFVDAEEHIEGYLDSIVNQTIFEDIDLLIYDAASTKKEAEIISIYTEKYPNIKHIRDENKIGSSEAFNKMINLSENEYIGMIMIDDRPAPHYAEILRRYIHFSNKDLVYGDCVQTYSSNSMIEESFYEASNLYEHSRNDFSRENMIKCQPGPMPMFRKSMIDKNGGFDQNFKHSNDWELWLRCVDNGSSFMKVKSRVGLYYFNPEGVTTSPENFKSKIREEASLFMKYRNVIGEANFNKYKKYFSQGL
jgi:hypothetical protein